MTAGLSGGVLLLTFQMSVLGFVTPAATPTNLLYNVFSTQGGVYRFAREDRMLWPLTATISAGSLPGVLLGAFVRLRDLPEPRTMRVFTGAVLLWLAIRLLGMRFGAYGAGGNAILAPYLVSLLRLPPHTVAGETTALSFGVVD
jgi:uncharacterized membrane protein YfcA